MMPGRRVRKLRQAFREIGPGTFQAVPWNGPYYARLGFREMAPGEITPGLVAVLDDEAAHGIDPATRVCMCRPTTARRA